ncbi:phosphonate metabolism transcriptional regulator PhnF [Microbaculum marinum]|uniref:Phosphonate metabolism transcriptional regulator PhnF n=1 Tax=Microbaculum marinum TaxID=1764581 RepID=A0AAW9RNT2_9HYPH
MADPHVTAARGPGAAPGQDGIALWRRIADSLRREIAAGEHAPGDRLPSESVLAERFGVNRHTVRRALAALAGDGLVRSEQGRGTIVRGRPLDYPIGPRTRFSEIVSRQARAPSGRLIAADEMSAEPDVAAALGIARGTPVLRLETLSAADGIPLNVATSWFPAERLPGFVAHYAETGSITRALQRCGVADYQRRETRVTARIADAQDALALGIAPGSPLIATESINADTEGRPIQYSLARFAADRVQIVVET